MADAGLGGLRPVSFFAGRDYAAGPIGPGNLATADLNGDGKLDLIVLNVDTTDPSNFSGSVSVLLGACNGTFAPRVAYAVGPGSPSSLAVADLNGDARPDFVVTGADGMSAWLNRGDGTFREGSSYPVAANPTALTVVDVDGDGRGDVVSLEETTTGAEVEIFHNAGDGTLSPGMIFAAGPGGDSLLAADLNGDGRPDLVTKSASGNGGVAVLMNSGAGALTAPVVYLLGVNFSAMALADVNGDGAPDLELTSVAPNIVDSSSVDVLLNDGSGAFMAPAVYPFPNAMLTLDVADLNSDGRPDLVVSDSSGEVTVLSNQGAGVFTAGTPMPRGAGGASVALGDMNGDQAIDLVVADFGQLSVLFNDGGGNFGAPTIYAVPEEGSLMLADLEGDGSLDVLLKNESDGSVGVLANDGTGVLAAPGNAIGGSAMQVLATGDLNGDGQVDLALAGQAADGTAATTSILRIALNNGGGVFTSVDYRFSAAIPSAIAVGDLNGDGKTDAAVLTEDDQASVFLNQGGGTFASAVAYPAGASPASLAIADLDGDGATDLVIADYGHPPSDASPAQLAGVSGNVRVLYGLGDGTFAAPVDTTVGVCPSSVAAGDLDGNGTADLVLGDSCSGAVSVLLNRGSRTFAPAASYTSSVSTRVILLADLNGDGAADLVVGPEVFLNHGDGTFAAGVAYPVGGLVALGDFNGDGTIDLGVGSSSGVVTVLLNDGRATFTNPGAQGWVGDFNPSALTAADFDGNGEVDLALLNGSVTLLLNTSH